MSEWMEELDVVYDLALLRSYMGVAFQLTPTVMAVVTFFTYVWANDEGNDMTAAEVFGALAL